MVKLVQNSWLGGQLDYEMLGRQDFQKYRKGASEIKNFLPEKRGGLTKRQGFDRLFTVNNIGTDSPLINNDGVIRMIPFAYKKDHGFVICITTKTIFCFSTYKSVVYKVGSIAIPSGVVWFDTADKINEIDYIQSGNTLYIVHRDKRPMKLWTNDTKVNNFIADSGNYVVGPFVLETLNYSNINTEKPTIVGCRQTRIAPAPENAGGKKTEYYKVSATFDGIETKPSSEFSSSDCIEPSELSSSSSGTAIQISTSTSDSTSQTTTVYVNKQSKVCAGTTYYLPWVESQSITLDIDVPKRNNEYPDHLNIYKKAYGYYGLIGTSKPGNTIEAPEKLSGTSIKKIVDGTETDIAINTFLTSESEANETVIVNEMISSSSDARATSLPYDVYGAISSTLNDATLLNLNASCAYWLNDGDTIRIKTAGTSVCRSASVYITLGRAFVRFTEWSYNNKTRPTKGYVKYESNKATSISYTFTFKSNVSGVDDITKTGTVNITAGSTFSSYTYRNSAYNTFKKNYLNKFIAYITGSLDRNKIGTTNVIISSGELTDEEMANGYYISSIDITFTGGRAVVSGLYTVTDSNGSPEKSTFTDTYITPDTSITPIETDYTVPFNGEGEYPGVVSICQQRLVFASSKNDPNRVWMSSVGDFNDFSIHEIQKESDSIDFSMPLTQFADINHIVEMKRLVAFNSACEWVIDSSSSVKGLTYETIRATPQSYSGSDKRIKPIVCNNAILFVERAGKSVRRIAYNLSEDGFAGKDISILSSSIFEGKRIVDWTYQQFPTPTVWCVLSDGTLASLTYIEEQDICSWAVHSHGNADAKFVAIATSYAIAPSIHDVTDVANNTDKYKNASACELFTAVKLPYGDGWKIVIERMRVKSNANDTISNSVCLDSARDTIANDILATGEIAVNKTTGEIVNSCNTTGYIAGYPIESVMTSMSPITGTDIGSGQYDIKSIANIGVRLGPSYGGEISTVCSLASNSAEPIRYTDNLDNNCSAVFTAETAEFKKCDCTNIKPCGINTRDGRIKIRQADPYPFSIIQTEVDYETEDGIGGK